MHPPETPELDQLDVGLKMLTAGVVGHRTAGRIADTLELIASTLSSERIVDWPEILRRTKLSKRTIQRQMDSGLFPSRVLLSDCRSGWLNSEVERWLRTRPRYFDEGE